MRQLVGDVLLPAFAVTNANAGMSTELWGVLSMVGYQARRPCQREPACTRRRLIALARTQDRYTLYGYWEDVGYSRHPELALMRAEALMQTKYFIKVRARRSAMVATRHAHGVLVVSPGSASPRSARFCAIGS